MANIVQADHRVREAAMLVSGTPAAATPSKGSTAGESGSFSFGGKNMPPSKSAVARAAFPQQSSRVEDVDELLDSMLLQIARSLSSDGLRQAVMYVSDA